MENVKNIVMANAAQGVATMMNVAQPIAINSYNYFFEKIIILKKNYGYIFMGLEHLFMGVEI